MIPQIKPHHKNILGTYGQLVKYEAFCVGTLNPKPQNPTTPTPQNPKPQNPQTLNPKP